MLTTEHAIFGGSMVLRAHFTGEGPGIYVIRAKTFAADPLGEEVVPSPTIVTIEVPDTGANDAARSSPATSRSGPVPSSMRPRSSSRAGEASARRRTTA